MPAHQAGSLPTVIGTLSWTSARAVALHHCVRLYPARLAGQPGAATQNDARAFFARVVFQHANGLLPPIARCEIGLGVRALLRATAEE